MQKLSEKPEVDFRLIDNLREVALFEDNSEQQVVSLRPP